MKKSQSQIHLLFNLFFLLVIAYLPIADSATLVSSNSIRPLVIPLVNKQNQGYYFTMQIGELDQNNILEMLVDTSRPFTWVPDFNCTNCFRTNLRSKYYDCEVNNETCKQSSVDNPSTLIYTFGNVSAIDGKDTIRLRNMPLNSTVNVSIYYALNVTDGFYDINADGIFGLGLYNKNLRDTHTHIADLLYEQKLIPERSFSLYLTDHSQGDDSYSQIMFGGYDSSKIKPDANFQTIMIASDDSWRAQLSKIKLGDIDVMIRPSDAIFSITSDNIEMPETDLQSIVKVLNNTGIECKLSPKFQKYVCPCTDGDLSLFPGIEFQLQNATFKLDSNAYVNILGRNLKDEDKVIIHKYDNCLLQFGIQPENNKTNQAWVFGNTFMRNYHSLFNLETKSVSFALAKQSPIVADLSKDPMILMVIITIILFALTMACSVFQFIQIRKKTEVKSPKLDINSYTL